MNHTSLVAKVTESVRCAADHIPTPLAWRSWRARKTGRDFDRIYGTDTQDRVGIESLGVELRVAEHAVWYEPSAIPKVRRALRQLSVRHEEYDFFDIGSGKGIVPLLAAGYPFRRVVGVEASRELHGIAERNLAIYRERVSLCAPIEFVNADALRYELPSADQVVYLYNPFDEVALGSFVDRLIRLPASVRLTVVYVNPVHRQVIEHGGRFSSRFDDGAVVVYRRT